MLLTDNMNGILLIDKPKGLTSHDVVHQARKSLQTKRIGHTGTLDPLATGLLVLLVGDATKLAKYFSEHDKAYEAEIILGIQTDTDDITGEVIAKADAGSLSEADIVASIIKHIGTSKQLPPQYSAIKHGGKKLYEYARKAEIVPDVDPREIHIYEIERIRIISRENRQTSVAFSCHVSKGTYIRALARDIGIDLGVFGTLKSLRRTALGAFSIANAVQIEDLEAGNLVLIDPLRHLLLPTVTLEEGYRQMIANGRFLPPHLFPESTDTIIRDPEGVALAIYRYDKERNVMRMSVKLT